MASSSRSLMALAVLGAALIALAANRMFVTNGDSVLYCSPPLLPSITTLDPSWEGLKEVAMCFRVENGVFTAVLDSESKAEKGEKITYIDGFVLPGIIESHGHILQYGEMLESVPLYGAESVAEIRTRIKDFLKVHEGEEYGTREKWIRGIGWDQAYFGGVMPTAVCFYFLVPGE
jgi:hypothetical protein